MFDDVSHPLQKEWRCSSSLTHSDLYDQHTLWVLYCLASRLFISKHKKLRQLRKGRGPSNGQATKTKLSRRYAAFYGGWWRWYPLSSAIHWSQSCGSNSRNHKLCCTIHAFELSDILEIHLWPPPKKHVVIQCSSNANVFTWRTASMKLFSFGTMELGTIQPGDVKPTFNPQRAYLARTSGRLFSLSHAFQMSRR